MGILGFADVGDRAVSGLGLQLLDSWNRGFESRWDMDVRLVFVVCRVGSGLGDGLIIGSEESCRVYVCVCVSLLCMIEKPQ